MGGGGPIFLEEFVLHSKAELIIFSWTNFLKFNSVRINPQTHSSSPFPLCMEIKIIITHNMRSRIILYSGSQRQVPSKIFIIRKSIERLCAYVYLKKKKNDIELPLWSFNFIFILIRGVTFTWHIPLFGFSFYHNLNIRLYNFSLYREK